VSGVIFLSEHNTLKSITLPVAVLIAAVVSIGAARAETYEGWYDTEISVPGAPVQKGTLHTYWDGKFYYGKQKDGFGNISAMKWEMPMDSTNLAFMQGMKAKALGDKEIDGKKCQGWSYEDRMMKRPSENWLDDTGHLYYQKIEKYSGADGTYVQKRTDFKLNPKSSDLPTDPEVIKSGS